MGFFLYTHDTISVPKWNEFPEVLFLPSMLPPQSLLVYPISLKYYEVEYIMPKYFVWFTFLNILCPTFQCDSFDVSMNFEIRLTPYIILGLVFVRHIRLPIVLLNSVGSTLALSSALVNFNPIMISVGATLNFNKLNLFKISCAYLDYEINIPTLDWWTSITKKYSISPK